MKDARSEDNHGHQHSARRVLRARGVLYEQVPSDDETQPGTRAAEKRQSIAPPADIPLLNSGEALAEARRCLAEPFHKNDFRGQPKFITEILRAYARAPQQQKPSIQAMAEVYLEVQKTCDPTWTDASDSLLQKAARRVLANQVLLLTAMAQGNTDQAQRALETFRSRGIVMKGMEFFGRRPEAIFADLSPEEFWFVATALAHNGELNIHSFSGFETSDLIQRMVDTFADKAGTQRGETFWHLREYWFAPYP